MALYGMQLEHTMIDGLGTKMPEEKGMAGAAAPTAGTVAVRIVFKVVPLHAIVCMS